MRILEDENDADVEISDLKDNGSETVVIIDEESLQQISSLSTPYSGCTLKWQV